MQDAEQRRPSKQLFDPSQQQQSPQYQEQPNALLSPNNDSTLCDMSFGSFYQMQQIAIAEERYKNLQFVQDTIRNMQLPGLPSSVRSRRGRKYRKPVQRNLPVQEHALTVPSLAHPSAGDTVTPDKANRMLLTEPPATRPTPKQPKLATTQQGFFRGFPMPERRIRDQLLVPLAKTMQNDAQELPPPPCAVRRRRKRRVAKGCKEKPKTMSQALILQRASNVYQGLVYEKGRLRDMAKVAVGTKRGKKAGEGLLLPEIVAKGN